MASIVFFASLLALAVYYVVTKQLEKPRPDLSRKPRKKPEPEKEEPEKEENEEWEDDEWDEDDEPEPEPVPVPTKPAPKMTVVKK